MPSDITGTDIIQEDRGTGQRKFASQGPLFANMLLADEINRTPPKTQAALLEAMQEHTRSRSAATTRLASPSSSRHAEPDRAGRHLSSPEAQLDRFMFKVIVEYPSYEEELTIAESTTAGDLPTIDAVLDREGILAIQKIVRKVIIARSVTAYAVQAGACNAPPFRRGAGVCQKVPDLGRRSSRLVRCCWEARHTPCSMAGFTSRPRTFAMSPGRCCGIAWPTSFRAESDGVSADHIVEKLFNEVREPMAK